MVNTKESLNIRLKHFREQKGLSQTQVADYLHLSRQAISQWESKRSYPDLDNIILLCELYEISVDELLGTNSKERNKKSVEVAEEKVVEKDENYSLQKSVFNKEPSVILETLCLAIILVLTSQFTVLGIIAIVMVIFWMKKKKRDYKIIYILCCICLLISLHNTYVLIEHFLNLGVSTIEPL